jgi:sulfopropanediol 3-dehydrogenase
MAQILKSGKSEAEVHAADAKVRGTGEGILDQVRQGGDAVVRELSEKFDKWSPPSFRLSDAEIEALIASLPQQTQDDLKFAQAQVRHFAQVQREALRDVEVETLTGVILGLNNFTFI